MDDRNTDDHLNGHDNNVPYKICDALDSPPLGQAETQPNPTQPKPKDAPKPHQHKGGIRVEKHIKGSEE